MGPGPAILTLRPPFVLSSPYAIPAGAYLQNRRLHHLQQASSHPDIRDQDALLKAADDALYVAKESGRDQVVRYDSAEFKSLVRLVASDPRVLAKLGNPVALASNAVSGRIEVDGDDGSADLRILLSGPKGRIGAHVDARLDGGQWSKDRIDFFDPSR